MDCGGVFVVVLDFGKVIFEGFFISKSDHLSNMDHETRFLGISRTPPMCALTWPNVLLFSCLFIKKMQEEIPYYLILKVCLNIG